MAPSARWLLLLILLATGCDLPGRPKEADRELPPDMVLNFDRLYRMNCAACHGKDGKFGAAPPLNDPLFLAIVPDEELRRVVTEGRPGTLMPAFAVSKGGRLTEQQVAVLADGIKKKWEPRKEPPKDCPPYQAPSERGNVEAGAKVFAAACASCHGDHGQGTGDGATAVGAVNEPAFLRLISDQALRRLVITGRPDLDMPDYCDPTDRPPEFKPLTAQDVNDLVAFLATWRNPGPAHDK